MVAATAVVRTAPADAAPGQLVHEVHEVMRAVIRRLQPALEREGISTGQFWALKLVSSLDSASVSALARHLALSAPTVCSNVDQLEAAGLVVRERSRQDRRAVVLRLTPKGRRVEARVWTWIAEMMAEAARGLPSQEVATALHVFEEVHRRLDGAAPEIGGSS